jgi:hypothetical protein
VKQPDSRPDSLIEALARRAREEDRMADPRWDALSAGELSPDAAEELRRLAEGGTEAPSDAYEMLKPFDEGEADALADGVFAALDRKREAAPEAPAGARAPSMPVAPKPEAGARAPSVSVASKPEAGARAPSVSVASKREAGARESSASVGPKPAPVIPFPKRGRALLYAATTVLSLAAGAALWFRLQGSGAPGIPAYTALVEGGRSDQRAFPGPSSEPSGRPPSRLSAGGRIDITLRPATTAAGDLTVRAFLVDARGARPWSAPVEPRPNGSFRVAGIERRMLPDPASGAVELVFVIGRPGALPSDGEMASRLTAHAPVEAGGAVQVVTVPLTLDEPR